MARILVVAQGALAEELARGARTIAGPVCAIATVALDWNESPVASESKVAAALAALQADEVTADGVLILTDLPGGTPFNIAKKFAKANQVEVISGVNLSMLVRLCCPGCEELSVGDLAEWLAEKGRQSICRYRPEIGLQTGTDRG